MLVANAMVKSKLFQLLVLGGITAVGCRSGGGAHDGGGAGGTTLDGSQSGSGGGVGGQAGAAAGGAGTGAAGAASAGAGGTAGAGGSAGAAGGGGGTGGSAGRTDAGIPTDAKVDHPRDAAVCCPPECEGHLCACAGGQCCWLVAPNSIAGCARSCFHGG
jgi:hypothetical protein